jgi:hypothetical protein
MLRSGRIAPPLAVFRRHLDCSDGGLVKEMLTIFEAAILAL